MNKVFRLILSHIPIHSICLLLSISFSLDGISQTDTIAPVISDDIKRQCYHKDQTGKLTRFTSIRSKSSDEIHGKFVGTKDGVETLIAGNGFQSMLIRNSIKRKTKPDTIVYQQLVYLEDSKIKTEKSEVKEKVVLRSWTGEIDFNELISSKISYTVIFSDSTGENIILRQNPGRIGNEFGDVGVHKSSNSGTQPVNAALTYLFLCENRVMFLGQLKVDKRKIVWDKIMEGYSNYPEVLELLTLMKACEDLKAIPRHKKLSKLWPQLNTLYLTKYFVEL